MVTGRQVSHALVYDLVPMCIQKALTELRVNIQEGTYEIWRKI